MSEGKKFDEGKIRYDLLPVDALREVARVLTFGAAKYGDNNWKITKPESRYTAAAFRHGEAYRGGEMMDKESGVHHLAHRICCDLFLLQIDMENVKGKGLRAEAAKWDARPPIFNGKNPFNA
jgi:hypothetical protein